MELVVGNSDPTIAPSLDPTKNRHFANAEANRPQHIGRFEIRQCLGLGAFGIVYRAYDPVLDREVALKVPRFATQDDHEIELFFREAKAAARLRHPNIVAVFECGKVDSAYYIAAEFVEGEPLSKLLDRARPPIREVVTWVQELAGAAAYAHGEGIVHRDIKPANIMVGSGGRPQLMDFGLAKSLRFRDDGTTDGSVVGTPAYMSPEQARGDVQLTGPLSDQYGLGAVLYQAITGAKPYSGPTASVVMKVADIHDVPRAPTAINPEIPKDLEACCLKAMNKVPDKRYANALDFSADLRRWLRGEPVAARPISKAERLARWCNRNRAVASMTAAIALLLVVGAVAASVAAFRFRNLAERERIAANKAEIALTDSYTNSGLVASDLGKPAQAVLWFTNAAALASHDPSREYANRIRARNWSHELPLPIAVLPDAGRLKQLAFHPHDRYLLTLSLADKFAIWDLEEQRPFPLTPELLDASAAAWSRDGKWLAIGKANHVVLMSFPEGKQRQEIAHAGAIPALEFSRDSRKLAIGGDAVQIWDIPQKRCTIPPIPHPKPVVKMLFNARGDRLVTAAQDELVRVFSIGDSSAQKPLFPPLPNLSQFPEPIHPLGPALIDDNQGLLTKGRDNEIWWWNLETGEKVRSLAANQQVLSVTPRADGKKFVVCDFNRVSLWDVAKAEADGELLGHNNFVYSAAYLADDKTVVTASADRKVGIWDATTGKPTGPMLMHQNEVDLVASAHHRNRFASAQIDGLVRVWQLPPRTAAIVNPIPVATKESYLTLSADGQFVTPAGWNHTRTQRSVRFYDVATGTAGETKLDLPGMVNHVSLSPDGKRFVTLCSLPKNNEQPPEASLLSKESGRVEFWSRGSDRPLFPAITTPSEPIGSAWSSDDKKIAVICGGGQILVINAQSGKTQHQASQDATIFPRYMVRTWIRFSPDGRIFATWGMGHTVRIWDAETGTRRLELKHGERCHDVQFSPRGDLIATMSMDSTAGIWNAATGKSLAQLKHPDWVLAGEFSRDGSKLLTACRDRMARLWDWKEGKLACPAMEHADEVFGVAFTDSDRILLTAGRDGTVKIWDSHIGKPLAKPLIQPGAVYQVTVTPDGKHAVCAGFFGNIAVLKMPTLVGIVDSQIDAVHLQMFGEIVSGQRVHEGGGVVNLTTQEWWERWTVFQAAHPRYEKFFPSDGQ